jgi:hypothetical protein
VTKSILTALKLGTAPIAICLALLAAPAMAQNEAAETDADTIVVTGSRIARPELEASIPVAVLSAQSIGIELPELRQCRRHGQSAQSRRQAHAGADQRSPQHRHSGQ